MKCLNCDDWGCSKCTESTMSKLDRKATRQMVKRTGINALNIIRNITVDNERNRDNYENTRLREQAFSILEDVINSIDS